jgi:hypothetical protein
VLEAKLWRGAGGCKAHGCLFILIYLLISIDYVK